MKKGMNPRKKYAAGTTINGVKNYIPNPADALAENNKMMAEAEMTALQNPWLPIVGIAGGLAATAVKSAAGKFKGFGTSEDTEDVDASTDGDSVVAANGMNNVNANVEVEGGEMYETPQGETGEFQGPSHEQGGIPMEVNQDIPEGTKVYSDRLKVGKETLAERKANRERQIANLEKIASKPLLDTAVKNATQRKMAAIQKEEMADLQFQEQVNNMQQMADTIVKAFGTSMAGVQANPIGDSMRYGMGTSANGVTEYALGTDGINPPPGFIQGFGVNQDEYEEPLYGSANINNYDTNRIKNLHDAIGIKPDVEGGGYGTAWGKKSNQALFNLRATNDPEWAAQQKKVGKTTFNMSSQNAKELPIGQVYQKLLKVTPEGYRFNPNSLSPEAKVETNPRIAEANADAAFYTPGQVGTEIGAAERLASAEEDAAFYTPGQVGTPIENLPGTMFSRGVNKMANKIGDLNEKGFIPGLGDMVSLFGNYLGATSGLKNAASQRASDITHTNVYKNAGKESQKQLDNAMQSIEGSKAQAIIKATSATRGGKKGGRGSARGINQMRAMDWLYDTALNQQIADISANAAGQVSDIFKAKSSVAMNADQLSGQGEYQAAMANEAAKDAYYTAMGSALQSQAMGVQQTGKDLNAMRENKIKENLMKQYGKWFAASEKGLTNKNGK